MNKQVKGSILLFVAALIWGVSLVAQSVGGIILGAYTFNAFRLLIGALFLHFAMKLTDRIGMSEIPQEKPDKKRQFIVGVVCGIFLVIATNLQQVALNMGVSSGKAGFLTALYILIVPIIGLFFKKKCGWNIWVGVGLAIIGSFFLCFNGDFEFRIADLLLIICALGFSCQIVVIDQFGPKVDSLRLSGMQFLFAGVVTFFIALFKEIIPYPGGFGAWLLVLANGKLWISLLYMGVFSCGIAYTLQILGQKDVDSTVAALIMSLESVFSALAGWFILKEGLSTFEFLGCALIFAAVILAQISFKSKSKKI